MVTAAVAAPGAATWETMPAGSGISPARVHARWPVPQAVDGGGPHKLTIVRDDTVVHG
jgi:hypothetical protein